MMKILLTSPIFCKPDMADVVRDLEKQGFETKVNPYGRTLKKEEIFELWQGVHGIIAGVEPYSRDVLEKAPDTLQVITRYGAGYNSVDIQAAAEKSIAVSNTPGANASAVADLTLGLMISAARRIPQCDAKIRQGAWSRYTGFSLDGKTLGIIGLGAIGKKVALRAKGFSMDILAFDPFFDEAFAAAQGVKKASLETICAEADYITLHLPVTEETEGMISSRMLELMKPTAFLINAARGELVDEQALYQALLDGRIAGAGLDVFETEPLAGSPLITLENVVLTPHMAGHTRESEYLMAKAGIENTVNIIRGTFCRDIVNREFLS